jgi:hypothetical protein
VFWSPSVLDAPNAADEINSSAVYGFVFDFCGIEVDRDTGVICVDKYVSLHDVAQRKARRGGVSSIHAPPGEGDHGRHHFVPFLHFSLRGSQLP